MSEAATPSSTDARWANERTITEFWASAGASNRMNRRAGNLPFGLGIFVYFPIYVLKAMFISGSTRYTLTNRRLRVDKGVLKKTVLSVALEDIAEIKIDDFVPFTRTGNLVLMGKEGELCRMIGIQDPAPARQTILDAVNARIEVSKVLARQKAGDAVAATS